QATHYSTIMHDLLFARASTSRASLTEQAVRRPPHDQHDQQADMLASPRLMNGARRPGEKTLAHLRVLSRGSSPRRMRRSTLSYVAASPSCISCMFRIIVSLTICSCSGGLN